MSASPASACTAATIYFDRNSAVIEEGSRAAVERLAVTLAWKGPDLDHVLLTSRAGGLGSNAAHHALAQRRATAVRDLLIANHVPSGMIEVRTVILQRSGVLAQVHAPGPDNDRVDLMLQLSAEAQGRQLRDGGPIC